MAELEPYGVEETTEEIVAIVAQKNRRVQYIVAACAIVVAILAGFWVFGSVDYSMEHKSGMLEDAHREAASKGVTFKTNEPVTVNEARKHPANAPNAMARITLSDKGEIWLDGQRVGVFTDHELLLEPGTHKIKAVVGNNTMIQSLPVKAGEEFILRFVAAEKRIDVMRLQE